MMLFLSFSNLYHFHELYVDYTTQNTGPPISMTRLCGLFERMAAARMQPATGQASLTQPAEQASYATLFLYSLWYLWE